MIDETPEHRLPKVLAVDDNPGNLLALEAALGSGYDILRALSGFQAIELLQEDPGVDVVLLDVQMPGLDGFETAEKIKAMPGYEDVPIIFVTAVHTEDPFVKRGYESGGVDYFAKPYDPVLLRMKVEAYAAYRAKEELLRRRERALRGAEDLLNLGHRLVSSLEDLPVGVLVTDAGGNSIQVSGEAALFQDTFTEDQRASMAAELRKPETLRAGVYHVPVRQSNGRMIRVSGFPLKDRDGEVSGALLVAVDVTRTAQLEKDLEDRIARLAMVAPTDVRPRGSTDAPR